VSGLLSEMEKKVQLFEVVVCTVRRSKQRKHYEAISRLSSQQTNSTLLYCVAVSCQQAFAPLPHLSKRTIASHT
jgi:hypothetical protein